MYKNFQVAFECELIDCQSDIKMTLGLFSDDFYPHIGGIGRYVTEIASRLPENKLLIFSPCENKLSNHIQIKAPFHDKFRNLSFSCWLHQNVEHLIHKHHLSRINIQCGPGGLFLLKKLNIPVIATCHHTWWQQSHYIHSQFWKKIFVPFEKQTYRLADRIICDSNDSKNILISKYNIPPVKMVVIPIGVDTHKFCPITNIKKIPNSMLFVGRVEKRKGADFLIRAMPLVAKKIPEVRLFVGGTGKELPKLRRYLKEVKVEKNVEFLGFIPENKLNEWYNKVQCVVVPSMFEGFGLTAIEAMAVGTCVVATKVDALKEIVEDDVNGFLVEYNDVHSLSDKIIYLLGDKTKQAEFIKKGKKKVATVYNWDITLERISKAYGQFP